MAKPTREMTEFAKECCRISGLNRAGLSTDSDFERLQRLGDVARRSQIAVNGEED